MSRSQTLAPQAASQQQPSAARPKPGGAEPAPLRRPGVKRPATQRVAPPQQQGSKRLREENNEDAYECETMPSWHGLAQAAHDTEILGVLFTAIRAQQA